MEIKEMKYFGSKELCETTRSPKNLDMNTSLPSHPQDFSNNKQIRYGYAKTARCPQRIGLDAIVRLSLLPNDNNTIKAVDNTS